MDTGNAAHVPTGGTRETPAGETSSPGSRRCPYALRPAREEDVPGLCQAEREAFPKQWPPTHFSRELAKPHTLYLVVVRPWTAEERAQKEPEREGAAVASFGSRLLSRLGDTARSVGLGAARVNEPSASPEYVAGFVGTWFVADETHIITIGARERARRNGVADLLLIGMAEAAVRRGSLHVTLEARRSNAPALSLYRKHGFREVGVRRRYYSDNGEDAVIMTTPPIQSDAYAHMLASLARDHAARWGAAVRVLP